MQGRERNSVFDSPEPPTVTWLLLPGPGLNDGDVTGSPPHPSPRRVNHLGHYTSRSVKWVQPSSKLIHRRSLHSRRLWTHVQQPEPSEHSQRQGLGRPGSYLPLISLVNLTLWESVRGFCCSSILLKSKTSQTNSITGCAL